MLKRLLTVTLVLFLASLSFAGKKKPEPDQIFHICEKFSVSVNEALLIGDSKIDIAAARNAGCYVFAVPYGYNQGCKIESDSVDALINHLSEVLGLIH